MKHRLTALAIILVLGLAAGATYASRGSAAPARANSAQNVLIHLSRVGEDAHPALMALTFAGKLQQRGARVSLMLDLEGVRMADKRRTLGSPEMNGKIATAYAAFTKAGGAVLLCPHCAEYAGLTAAHLRPGARIATEDELATLVLSASKTLDY